MAHLYVHTNVTDGLGVWYNAAVGGSVQVPAAGDTLDSNGFTVTITASEPLYIGNSALFFILTDTATVPGSFNFTSNLSDCPCSSRLILQEGCTLNLTTTDAGIGICYLDGVLIARYGSTININTDAENYGVIILASGATCTFANQNHGLVYCEDGGVLLMEGANNAYTDSCVIIESGGVLGCDSGTILATKTFAYTGAAVNGTNNYTSLGVEYHTTHFTGDLDSIIEIVDDGRILQNDETIAKLGGPMNLGLGI